jgi:16S rRNA (guanine(966)-N(2))-methyltransferase RsmD
MRIISGKYNRRILHPPKNLPVRPTTDLAKESLFNILNSRLDFEDKNVLELFAGTGSISLEFVSRGCKSVLSVDNNQRCVSWIRDASKSLGIKEITALRSDVFRFIKQTHATFDIIFADPPYDMEGIENISLDVFENKLLTGGGWLIVEHPKHIDFSKQPFFVEHRKYGKVNFSFFQNPEE